jgi:O-antigen ligase/polysaccharide polymerase Wzy-like membrane protein
VAWTSVKAAQSTLLRDAAVGIVVAVAVFALTYANGGFAPTTRAYAGIAAWWLLGVGAAFGIASARTGIDRLALAALGLLAAFDIWILISIRWASDAERAFAQFDQVALYVAVLAIAIVLGRLVPGRVVIGGVAVALSGVAVVALVSRCFPSTFGLQPGSTILLPLKNRLSFPLGYWNGLGIAVALAYPLLLSIMVSRRSRVASALAALPLPVLAAVMYLTSSRGAFVAAAVAVVAFVVLTPKRWPVLAALVLAGGAGAVAVAVLVRKTALVDGDVDTAPGVHEGHHAALWIGIACVVTALVWAGLVEAGRKLPSPPRRAGQATAVVIVVAVLAAIVLAHPIAKFDEFKSNAAIASTHGTNTTNHLLTSSGSGRWQFWGAAVSEFRAHPLNGGGAGSWGAWWLQHGTLPGVFTLYAHSLYLEALAELGIVGLLLLLSAVIVAVAGAVRSALALQSGEIAAAAACGIAFFAAAAYDWVWQLSGIAVVGVGMLGFALGAIPSTRSSAAGRFGTLRPALALVAVAAIVPQYVVLAAGTHLRNSETAFNAGNGTRARSEALAAKAIEPWAASPYLQLGLVSEAQGNNTAAAHWLDEAIRRSRRDWTLWLTAARIETRRGHVGSARRDLAEARRLNPSSPVFR